MSRIGRMAVVGILLCAAATAQFTQAASPSSAEPEGDTSSSSSSSSENSQSSPVSGIDEPVPSCGTDLTGNTCEANPDVGSAPSGNSPGNSVGNPINLMSGNKHQSEVDFQVPGAMLSLRRMYNSSSSDASLGLGQGWHHSYSVSLFDAGNGTRQIVQSNGAHLVFTEQGVDGHGYPLYVTPQANQGYVTYANERHLWHLPDGRTLSFHGSFLIEINWPDQRKLKLYYRARRLHSVTDETGRVLRFGYSGGSPANLLPSYDEIRFGSAPGFLDSVTLPDGQVIGYDYDQRRNLTRVRYPDGTHREYHYENQSYPSHLTGLTDQTGTRFASWHYDDDGRAILSEHADGVERVTLEYPDSLAIANGDVVHTRVTNSLGYQSTYSWQQASTDIEPRLLASEGAGCATCPSTGIEYTYDEQGRLLRSTNTGQGNATGKGSTTYSYDDQGRIAEVHRIDVAGTDHLVERREYSANSLMPVRTFRPSVNPQGERVVEIERTDQQLPQRIIESGYAPVLAMPGKVGYQQGVTEPTGYRPIKRITTLSYNNLDQLIGIDGPRVDVEDVVRLSYDAQSRLIAMATPLSPTLHLSGYDALGRLTSYQLGTQREVLLTRDDKGRVIQSRQGERVNTFTYNVNGRMTSVTDSDGRTQHMRFDAAGRMIAITNDLGRTQELGYDSESRLTGRSSLAMDGTLIHSLETIFDPSGHVSRVTEQHSDNQGLLNVRTLNISEGEDSRSLITDFTDSSSAQSTQVRVDKLTRLAELINADEERTRIGVDELDIIASVTDARNNTTAHYRDDFGQSIILSSADTGVLVQAYDTAGNLIETHNEAGDISTFQYDAANRLTERSDSDGITHWRWDIVSGGLAEVSNSQGVETFTYNGTGLLASHVRLIDQHRFETRYRYDARDRLNHTSLPDGQSLQHHYHESGPNRGQLKSITRGRWGGLREQVLVDQIDQDARDGNSGYVSSAGVRTDYRYGATGQVQSIVIGQTLTLEYQVDAAGHVIRIDENDQPQHYAYQGDTLTMADTLEGLFSYAYDAAGNRTHKRIWQDDQLVNDEQYRYTETGQGNRLLERIDALSSKSELYQYNVTGSPIIHGELRYEYDAKEQPIALYRDERLVARYAYNGFGERIKKVVYGGGRRPKVTYYLYSNSTLVAEADEHGDLIAQYVYLEDHRPVLKLHAKEAFLIHTDHLGAPRVMSDEQGKIRWQARYSPFGKASIQQADVELPLRLPGQYADAESGTHYNYLRNYAPETGRYLRSDPIGLGGGINTYAYAQSNPLGAVDPLGLQAVVASPGAAPAAWRIINTYNLGQYVDLTRTPANQRIPPPRIGVPATAVLRSLARANALITLADTSYRLGAAGAALTDALIFAPADQAELVAHIRRYDSSYEPTGASAQLNRDGIRALGQELFRAQVEYLDSVAGSCPTDQQLYYDAEWAVYGVGAFSPVSQQNYALPGRRFFNSDEAYRTAVANYELAGSSDGTGLSFDEWWLNYGSSGTVLGLGETISRTRQEALDRALEEWGIPAGTEPDEVISPDSILGQRDPFNLERNVSAVLYGYLRKDGVIFYVREDYPVSYNSGGRGDQTGHFNVGTNPLKLSQHHFFLYP